MKDTITNRLLGHLFELVAAHRSAFRQERVFRRAISLLLSEIFAFGRHTVTQGLLALGLTEGDWSAWYRLFSHQRYAEDQVSQTLLAQTLAHVALEAPYVIGVDATQVPRSSQKMPGTGWLKATRTAPFKPGIHRAQRFEHISWLVPIQGGYSRAVPLRFLPAFPEKAVPATEGSQRKEWEAGLMGVGWVREQLDAHLRQGQALWVLADGAYDRVEFWRGLPEGTFAAVRTAKNRVLRKLPQPHPGKGRKALYGEPAPAPQAYLQERQGWRTHDIAVRGRQLQLSYRVEGPFLRERVPNQPLFLIVVRGNTWKAGKKEPKRKYRQPSYYLVSAQQQAGQWVLPLPIEQVLAWLWQRWEMEVAHRELKSGLGLGEKQCWNKQATIRSVQWSAWVYAVLVLAAYRTWGLFDGPQPPARFWRGGQRWSLSTMWREYRLAFWGSPQFRPLWLASGDNWLKKDTWLQGMWNAVIAAARI